MMNPIQDYAVIGDCRAAALVSKDGSIDWLCWPRFDSPSIFGAILDQRAGRWSIAPATPFSVSRRYVDGTNVLQTRYQSAGGTATVTDLMPVASEKEKRALLLPDHEILRIIECERGDMEIQMLFEPRPDFGREQPRIHDAGSLGVRFDTREGLLVLRTDMRILELANGRMRASAKIRAGERRHVSLTFADDWPAILPPLGDWSVDVVARSIRWWQQWSSRLRYDGPARDAVVRSALALKLLVYAPSGAVVAAPTTSLPERIGGNLNWDYRFCWLRDASLTIRALFGLGCLNEADAFVSWLLHATHLTQPKLRILYDVYGKTPEHERVLSHLSGHTGSRPVRIGNAATEQLQLDVYGEVIDAVTHFVRTGGTLDRETQRMLCAFGEYVCRHWHEPDEGIWEPRSGKGHNTHSRVLCWTALDRLLQLHAKGHLRGAPVAGFENTREQIRREVTEHAWNRRLESYVSRLEEDRLDASLLLLAWYGFEDARSDRMRKTYSRIYEHLGAGNGLLYRYRTSDSPGEGAFGVCSFWGAEYLALGGGTVDEARDTFERLCGYGNDVGLFAEEIDPSTGAALGNFPQAFTHVGLINAALSLTRRLQGEAPLERGVPAPEAALETRAAHV
jgi:GH15 family glucan-1,4-alpha-glucosidase